MTREVRVRGIRRREIDEDKLALAFLLLAKALHEQRTGGAKNNQSNPDEDATSGSGREAA